MKKKLVSLTLFLSSLLLISPASMAQVNYDANVIPIFGSGNPVTDWNAVQENGFVIAARAKERFTAPVMYHVNEVYYIPISGLTPVTRSDYNIEISFENLGGPIGDVDCYLKVDRDPSVGINYAAANVLTTWNDNSYGYSSTGNGAGVEGTAATYAHIYSIVQLSQNLGFGEFLALGVINPKAAATRDFIAYIVPKGAGPDAEALASVQIQVVTGEGGASILDLIAGINTSGMNHGAYVNAVKAIAKYLFDGGVINNKEVAVLVSTAAKSNIGR